MKMFNLNTVNAEKLKEKEKDIDADCRGGSGKTRVANMMGSSTQPRLAPSRYLRLWRKWREDWNLLRRAG